MQNKEASDPSLKYVIKILALLCAEFLGMLLLYELRDLLISTILAITIASAISPIAEAAEKHKIPRIITVLFIYGVTGIIYVVFAANLIPAISEQAIKLSTNLPDYLAKVLDWVNHALALTGNAPLSSLKFDTENLQNLSIQGLQKTMNMTAGLFGLFLNGILIIFLSAYFVIEAKTIWPRLLMWIPESKRQRFAGLIVPLEHRMGGYIRGQLLVAIAVGIFFTIGFSLLQLRYGLLMGVLAGLLNLVPYVGSMIATITATLVAFNQDPKLAIIVIALYAIEQWIESTFIVPLLLGRQVSLHPLVVLFAILSGASLMGIPGALISVPLVSAGLLLAEEFYLKPNNTSAIIETGSINEERAKQDAESIQSTNTENTLAPADSSSPVAARTEESPVQNKETS